MTSLWIPAALLVISASIAVTECSQCDTGWFGDSCQYQCNCKNVSKCLVTGDCQDDQCKENWFGPQCQYKYLTSTSATTWLTDGDNTTCANRNTVTSPLVVDFSSKFVFTWMRIVVNDPAVLNDLSITFANADSSDVRTVGSPLVKQRVSATQLDVHGRLQDTVSKVILTGDGVKALCSLYVSTGRDITLKQTESTQSDDVKTLYGAQGSCTLITPLDSRFPGGGIDSGSGDESSSINNIKLWWELKFNQPITVSDIVLVQNQQNPACSMSRFFNVSAFYKDDEVAMQQESRDRRLIFWTAEPVDTMIITVNVSRRSLKLCKLEDMSRSLCQLKVYGDNVCATERWGRRCSFHCRCSDVTEHCHVSTGACASGCFPGFGGLGCVSDCPQGTYGKGCANKCSEQCRFKKCDPVNGQCSHACDVNTPEEDCRNVCNAGYFGKQCSMKCPEHCADETCDQLTGACTSCETGYRGINCSLTCERGFFGDKCAKQCNLNCKDGVCDHVTGECTLGCQDDAYKPPDCVKGVLCNKTGWFGEDCRYQCKCARGVPCDKDGNCAGNKCEQNWFGPQCQYRNMITWATSMTVGNWIFDGNDKNCASHQREGMANLVSFAFSTVVRFTWLRIVVETPEAASDITVTFTSANGNLVNPLWMRRVRVSDLAMDVHGRLPKDIRAIVLWGRGLIHLCSVYVSGGRDMSLKQQTSFLGPAHIMNHKNEPVEKRSDISDVAVDGNEMTCIKPEDLDSFKWTVHYEWPVALSNVFLVTDDKYHCLSDRIHLDSYHFDQNLNIVRDTVDTPPPGQVKFNVMTDVNISALSLTLEDVPLTNQMEGCENKHTWALCEVQTFGDSDCGKGRWGRECERECTCADPEDECIISTGMCNSGCKPGHRGEGCGEVCEQGRWGVDCVRSCSPFCNPGSCDPVDGTCYNGCLPGYSAPLCVNECPPGLYGAECRDTCPPTCQECEQATGQCKACKAGFTGERCEVECPPNYYGEGCQSVCSKTCLGQLCDPVTGACETCPPGKKGLLCDTECSHGWFGPNCSYPCSSTCKGRLCSQVDGTCYSCVPGYTGLLCEDVCPPKFYGQDCQQECSESCDGQHCDHVTGECITCPAGSSGDECASECPPGKYGASCAKSCSSQCSEGACDSVTGFCSSCLSGYFGDLCNHKCLETYHGPNCQLSCSENCAGMLCDHVNGTCLHCIRGKMGPKCDQDCPDGKYGPDCSINCPDTCLDAVCDAQTGACLGCDPGFTGKKCEQVCPSQRYGRDCAQECSRDCIGQLCDHVTGACRRCMPGKKGDMCDQDCDPGWYGGSCLEPCAVHCGGSGACDGHTGECTEGCKPGYMGEMCQTTCPHGMHGVGCTEKCGKHCVWDVENEPAICDPITGACLSGCVTGYYGEGCVTHSQFEAQIMDHPEVAAGIGIGIPMAFVGIIGLFCVIRYYRKYRNAKDPDKVKLHKYTDLDDDEDIGDPEWEQQTEQKKEPLHPEVFKNVM